MKKPIFNIEVHEEKPDGFSPQVEVAACYLEIHGKFLILQRSEGKVEGGKWGVPAGKLEKGETPLQGAVRELFEETGIYVDISSQLRSLAPLYIRKPEMDYVYHVFKLEVEHFPSVHLSDEHQNYQWASLQDLKDMPLMAGALQALEHYLKESR